MPTFTLPSEVIRSLSVDAVTNPIPFSIVTDVPEEKVWLQAVSTIAIVSLVIDVIKRSCPRTVTLSPILNLELNPPDVAVNLL